MTDVVKEKNNTIAYLETFNSRMDTLNKNLVEIQTKSKNVTEEERRTSKTDTVTQKKAEKQDSKCKYIESGFCKRQDDDCHFRHPHKVCLKFLDDKCLKGKHCAERHPRRACKEFLAGGCENDDNLCINKHSKKKSPVKQSTKESPKANNENTTDKNFLVKALVEEMRSSLKEELATPPPPGAKTAETIANNQLFPSLQPMMMNQMPATMQYQQHPSMTPFPTPFPIQPTMIMQPQQGNQGMLMNNQENRMMMMQQPRFMWQ